MKLKILATIIGVLFFGTLVLWYSSAEPETYAEQDQKLRELLPPVSERDHIYGDLSAPVKIIEYSELECGSCKRFHPIMQRVMETYGPSGEVVWIYRHFPLLHKRPKSLIEGQAAECVAEQKGENGFWDFIERFFEVTPSNNATDLESVIPMISSELGLDTQALLDCIESERYRSRVLGDLEDARAAGGMWRPWIIVMSDHAVYEVSGAQSYYLMDRLINLALRR